MSYSVNPLMFRSIFAVPCDIVDKHIRLANEHQLKVLLWILRNSPDSPDIKAMCSALKINEDDAADYLQYWVLTGVISKDGTVAAPPEPVKQELKNVKAPEAKAEPKAEIQLETPSKPSSSEILARIDESPEIGHLFNEAQIKLGKTIGYDGQCTLLLLHDHYGLPAEVLFMLIEYCVSVGKTNYGYIEAVGKDWGLKEIDTLEKAAEQITTLNCANSVWKEVAATAGLSNPRPTSKQAVLIGKWNKEFGFGSDIIYHAYEEMVNHTGKLNFNYMDRILTNWAKAGVKNLSDIDALKAEKTSSPSPAAKSTTKPAKSNALEHKASYDLDAFNNESLYGEIKYERKKKK